MSDFYTTVVSRGREPMAGKEGFTWNLTDPDGVVRAGGTVTITIFGDVVAISAEGLSRTHIPPQQTTVWLPRQALDALLDALADAHAGVPDPTASGVEA